MFKRIRQALRRWADTPSGYGIVLAVYLLMLMIGVYILLIFAKIGWRMVQGALGA